MKEDKQTTGRDKLGDAAERFEILKNNTDNFEAQEQIELASCIRNNVVNDNDIVQECNINLEQSDFRKKLLEEIMTFQSNVIKNVLANGTNITFEVQSEIRDFSQAKEDLYKLVSNELERNMFDADKFKDLFASIVECKTHIESLSTIKDNCEHGKFTILLMGEYQSGKTTTLDALCDGRHIGTIGDGTPTSAVPVTVSYADNDYVEIKWKTASLLKPLFSHLHQYFEQFDYHSFDLDNAASRIIWSKILDEFRSDKDFQQMDNDELKYMSLCTIVLKYYESTELAKVMNTSVDLSSISGMTKFPKNLESRWKKSGVDNFSVAESVFVFIEQVNCFCPSKMLKHLNCTVVDCPGLFSSKYDTEVTENAMTKAHAILYLLPRDKGIGRDVCGSLYTIQKKYADVHRKLFVVNNLSVKNDNEFFDSNCEKIKSMFGENKSVTPFDARLAYLGRLKYSHNQGKIPLSEIQQFVDTPVARKGIKNLTIITFKSFEEAWKYRIKGYKEACGWEDCPTQEELDEVGGLFDLVNELKSFIEVNEAYSIILSEGISKLCDEMVKIRSAVETTYVEPYTIGQEQLLALWNKRLKLSESFSKAAVNIINSHFYKERNGRTSLLNRLSHTVYKNLFTDEVYSEMINDICETVYENKWELFKRRKKEQDLKNFIAPKIEEVIASTIERRITYWNGIMSSNHDTDFLNIFSPAMDLLEKDLIDEWSSVYKNDAKFATKMKDYLTVPKTAADFDIAGQKHGADIKVGSGNLMKALLMDIGVAAASIAMAVASYICFLITSAIAGGAITVSNPVTLVIGMIVFLGGSITIAFKGSEAIKTHFIKKIVPEIKQKIEEQNLFSKFETMIRSEIERRLDNFGKSLSVDANKMKREKDLATSTPEEKKEKLCIRAIKTITEIDNQMQEYADFKSRNVKHEDA